MEQKKKNNFICPSSAVALPAQLDKVGGVNEVAGQ